MTKIDIFSGFLGAGKTTLIKKLIKEAYQGERIVRYKGATYAVYRTYHARTDALELYVERKGGTNGLGSNETSTGDS